MNRLLRNLVSGRAALARPTRVVEYPRWINPKRGAEDVRLDAPEDDSPSSSSSDSASSGAGSSGNNGNADDGDAPPPPKDPPPPQGSIAKQSVPEVYPQVLALPIARRPLFPGFYKAVVVRNPAVVAAIKDMVKRGQPYLGAFLLKDENTDSDVITDVSTVHPVGVFAQITSVFTAAGEGGEGEEGLTAVLYPHRRVVITELLKAGMAKVETVAPEDPQSVTAPPPPEPPVDPPPGPVQTSFLHSHPVSIVAVQNLPTLPYAKDDQHIRAFTSELIAVFKDIAQLNPLFRDQITNFTMHQVTAPSLSIFDEPDKLADFAAAVSSGDVTELQDVLESQDVTDRLRKALLVLKKELINAQLQSKLARDVDSKIAKRQREYYLMEQLKGIKKELGMESDGKDRVLEKFRDRAKALGDGMPAEVRKVFDEEMSKLAGLEPAASEAGVTRNYLEWLTQLPWGQFTPENFSLAHAKSVLDADHYGLPSLKSRILEFLAVRALLGSPSPHTQAKILLLSGPPGVGKTSIGRSIARALGRPFFRFSVGGLSDVAEIKGHRRTYVGALPGKVVQALKRVGSANPVVVIDEVDKVGRGHNGDPASALLEMLDPEQNGAFLDHYMDVPIDLSPILFICTANTLSSIPAPLLDRMEVLEVSGYVAAEKMQIAKRYLAPQAQAQAGLEGADVVLEENAIEALIRWYCRESGVRGLKREIEKIYRKAALKIVQDMGEEAVPEAVVGKDGEEGEESTVAATPTDAVAADSDTTPTPDASLTSSSPSSPSTPDSTTATSADTPRHHTTHDTHPRPASHPLLHNLRTYVGPPVYQRDRMYDSNGQLRAPPPGVSTGLGYLGNGSGAVMPVEAVSMPGKGGLQLTGKLGEVIRESAHIGLSWVKAHAVELGIVADGDSGSGTFLDARDIHVHMPEGSVGKEGPSAGTAIVAAFVSLFTKTRISPDIAMTGEISLVGQVLPVGGLKEKILAAHRAGITTIVAPAANRADIEENEESGACERQGGDPLRIAERWKETLPVVGAETGVPVVEPAPVAGDREPVPVVASEQR
ncbi:Lon protease-like protein, mitochondrial [Mycena sanguinolenta]|uniref:endopeptidase La n=1 Tax=Mycena sanguinolenta TaxID=230812 RepID=A0A8H7CXK1_9AGAR|nr:Lon protease-like protein, mitochondrial [Mycena sanguinolenta]